MGDATTLTDFLLDRIAEDEGSAVGGAPERLMRECAAKRAIVEPWATGDGPRILDVWIENGEQGAYPLTTLRALARVYAGHPDYRDEWD